MNHSKGQQEAPPTLEQCHQWWAGVQMTLANIARQALQYLPDDRDDGLTVLDPKASQDISEVLFAARTGADTATGAYSRAVRMEHEERNRRAAAADPARAPQAAAGQPRGGW